MDIFIIEQTNKEPAWSLYNGEPCHTNNNIHPPVLSTSVLVCPHAVAVDIPERPGGRVHTTLASIAKCAICSNGRVNHALLHDCAVHGEAVGRGLGGIGCGSSNQSLEDGVLCGELLVLALHNRVVVIS
jgi:hypothetical protein